MNLLVDRQVMFSTQKIFIIHGVFQKETLNTECSQQVCIIMIDFHILPFFKKITFILKWQWFHRMISRMFCMDFPSSLNNLYIVQFQKISIHSTLISWRVEGLSETI